MRGTFAELLQLLCNTVFAPLGADLGGEELVETSELFGFNSPPEMFDQKATAAVKPPASTIPEDLSSSVEVGESAIGQDRCWRPVADGHRVPDDRQRGHQNADADRAQRRAGARRQAGRGDVPGDAATVRDLMIGLVDEAPGSPALPGVQVAGKTGTAELGPAPAALGDEEAVQELDAWFTAPPQRPDARGGGDDRRLRRRRGRSPPRSREVLATGLGVQ